MSQLLFKFKNEADYSRHNFIVSACNEEAFSLITKWPDWPSHCAIIYGPESCGKTHLCNIWKEISGAKDFDSNNTEQVINNVVLENIESANIDEKEILHLYNLCKEEKKFLLITANKHPSELGIKLNDLRSRLNASQAIKIDSPDDHLLAAILKKGFADRQLTLRNDVAAFLQMRLERSFSAYAKIVEELDRISMQKKSNITIPVAKDALKNLNY